MEIAAGIGKADGPAVLGLVGQDQNVREARIVELVDDVRLGPAEAARERKVLRGLKPLALDRQHLGVEEGP